MLKLKIFKIPCAIAEEDSCDGCVLLRQHHSRSSMCKHIYGEVLLMHSKEKITKNNIFGEFYKRPEQCRKDNPITERCV